MSFYNVLFLLFLDNNSLNDTIPPSKPEIKVISGTKNDQGIYTTEVEIEIIPGKDSSVGIKNTTYSIKEESDYKATEVIIDEQNTMFTVNGTKYDLYGGSVTVAEVDGEYQIVMDAGDYGTFGYKGLPDGFVLPSEGEGGGDDNTGDEGDGAIQMTKLYYDSSAANLHNFILTNDDQSSKITLSFNNQDVLFLQSTLVLNDSSEIK